ncbi:MAG: hypothetical protein K6E63_05520 [Lachnospiraceae bacterium]|nr:hypothetical protein [Lachnospiraceae bacterium]
MQAVEDGIYNETTAMRMKQLEERKSLLENDLFLQKNIKKNELTELQIVKYIDKIMDIKDVTNRRRLLDVLVDKIYLYNDKVVISCTYTEKNREIWFEKFEEDKKFKELMDDISLEERDYSSWPWSHEETLKSLIGEQNDFFR